MTPVTKQELLEAIRSWAHSAKDQDIRLNTDDPYLIVYTTREKRARKLAFGGDEWTDKTTLISVPDLESLNSEENRHLIARNSAMIMDLDGNKVYRPTPYEPLPGALFSDKASGSLSYFFRGGYNTKQPSDQEMEELFIGKDVERAALTAFSLGLRMAGASYDGEGCINTLEMDPSRFYVHVAQDKIFALAKRDGKVDWG